MDRRGFLAALAAGVTGVSGCLGAPRQSPGRGTDDASSGTAETGRSTANAETGAGTAGGSRWAVLTGEAVDGPHEGTRLAPANDRSPMFWFAWADFHPDTALYEPRVERRPAFSPLAALATDAWTAVPRWPPVACSRRW